MQHYYYSIKSCFGTYVDVPETSFKEFITFLNECYPHYSFHSRETEYENHVIVVSSYTVDDSIVAYQYDIKSKED